MQAASQATARPGTLRSLLGRIVALILLRAEIFSLEAQEHKTALVYNLAIATAAFSLLLLGLFAALLFIALATPTLWRTTVLGGIALTLLLLAGTILWRLKRRLECQSAPFALTLSEVQKDWDALNGKD